MMNNWRYTSVPSPIGELLLVSDGESLTGLWMENHQLNLADKDRWAEDGEVLPFPLARRQLAEYFAGERTVFTIPLNLHGTPFQLRVWEELLKIPFGETISYKELAIRIGRPASIRAVGQANGNNPISIIVPCHRVIGSNGKLTGYGGGLPRKEALLNLEARIRNHRNG